MGPLPKEVSYSPTSHHLNLLQQVIDESDIENHLVRSYKRSFNGFAAILNDQQRERLAGMRDVVSVFPSQEVYLQTTRSWDFVGLPQSIKRDQIFESDLVIGVIDSGIWPESESFNDKGFGPIPKKWNGVCAGGKNFRCNNKIIGARFYDEKDKSARDNYGFGPIPKKWNGVCAGGKNFRCNNKIIGARFYDEKDESARDNYGHGTHTTSIAGGNEVNDVSFYGLAKGTIRGGVPSSRIAVYKICIASPKCGSDSILAAFDDAIADGVDIITASVSPPSIASFMQDVVAIGSFHAMEKRIPTTHAAGNQGPTPSSVISVAPWLLSVAASTIDRKFIDKLILGNGKKIIGKSINTFPSNGTKFPIAQSCPDLGNASHEMRDSLDKNMVKGKLVLCGELGGVIPAYENGAIGAIINVTKSFDPYVTPKPSIYLVSNEFVHVQSYTNSTKYPVAEILKSEIFHDNNAPTIVYFSSRGPNPLFLEIMKPDISAPGVGILSAWSPFGPPSASIGSTNKRHAKYNILSGTSMSCPHVAGVVAYVKSFHPNWSPAAIKSAIMTTAKPVKGPYDDLAGEFAYGSGNINPQQAVHPGLVYDITKEDYVEMLCNYGYDANKIKQISGDNSSCHGASKRSLAKDTNYPAMVIPVHKHFNVKIHRTVTNVGFHNSTYKAILIHPNPKVKISVKPKILSFRSLNEKQSFVVTVVGEAESNQTVFSSSLVWFDGTHTVRSPIIVQRLS